MNKRMKQAMSMLFALCMLVVLSVKAATDIVLQLYGTNVMEFTVEDGVWTYEGDFANTTNYYGGKKYTLKGLASDGRRVFIGEQAGGASRILEFDMEGNYQRVLKTVGSNIEHMTMSHDGKWIYANLNAWSTSAAVHRYSAITGSGYSDITDSSGEFIPNKGTNELGTVLWEFNIHRGVTTDDMGNLWVSDRTAGKVFKFRESDGAYLGSVAALGSVQGLYYNADDKKIYCTSSGDNTYVIDTTNMTREVVYFGANTNNRLGVTKVADDICSACFDGGLISSFDFDSVTSSAKYSAPDEPRELIALPRDLLRPKEGELLISETVSNRVIRLSFDSGNAYDIGDEYFAGGDGVTYNGTALREPRGLAVYSNYVYIAEGIAGGRILKFSKWGSFKSVALDFSQTVYSNCVPAALAVTPDGQSLYVTDAHTLYIKGDGSEWSNGMPSGYLSTNTYGETVFKVDPKLHTVSIFADSDILDNGKDLVEPRGVAVDADGRVYFNSWYNDPDQLYNAAGYAYQVDSSANVLAGWLTGNLTTCYYDPIGEYSPAAGNVANPGPGIILSGFGIQDFFWVEPGSSMGSTPPKLLDNGYWRTYMDAEVINGQLYYTDPGYGNLYRRLGDNNRTVELSGLAEPTYMTFSEVSGEEPPAEGTVILVQ